MSYSYKFMAAPDYAAKRADLAKNIGLGRKPGHKAMQAKAPTPAAKRPRKLSIKV